MQTFLPYPDLTASARLLDGPRLGKQRVEVFQILRALTWPQYAWKNHPAVRMWRGFVPGLVAYGVAVCQEWTRRGASDSVLPQLLGWTGGLRPADPELPPWFGRADLHRSHRSALLRKDRAWYGPRFAALGEPDLPDDLEYLWPPAVFPRWPLRRDDRDLDLPGALELLGLDTARPAQARAARAAAGGRDVLLVARPGGGGTTAALLAGLLVPGPVVRLARWVRPDPGPVPPVPLVPAAPPRAAGTSPTARADPGPAVARAPSPADLAAMRAEAGPSPWVFGRPEAPPDLQGAGLVVVHDAQHVASLALPSARPPVLAVVDRADAARRADLVRRLGLRAPVLAGLGWDPGSHLAAVAPATAAARRRLLAQLATGPALVLVDGRDRADRLVAALLAAGRRAAAWAPAMRPSRATAAVGAFRTRRLDALVVPDGALPPLGRGRLRLLVAADPPPLARWRDLVAVLDPLRSVLVAGPGAPPQALEWAAGQGCLRAALLAPYGEPVDVPCGRCERCDGRQEQRSG